MPDDHLPADMRSRMPHLPLEEPSRERHKLFSKPARYIVAGMWFTFFIKVALTTLSNVYGRLAHGSGIFSKEGIVPEHANFILVFFTFLCIFVAVTMFLVVSERRLKWVRVLCAGGYFLIVLLFVAAFLLLISNRDVPMAIIALLLVVFNIYTFMLVRR